MCMAGGEVEFLRSRVISATDSCKVAICWLMDDSKRLELAQDGREETVTKKEKKTEIGERRRSQRSVLGR